MNAKTNTIKVTMNDTRTKVIEALKNSDKALTLKEISELIGTEVKTGTTNAMVTAGLIVKSGVVKVPVVSYREVATYAIGDVSVEDLAKQDK